MKEDEVTSKWSTEYNDVEEGDEKTDDISSKEIYPINANELHDISF